MILGNAWIVTCDDAATEHRHGWLRIEAGRIAEIGAGAAPMGAEDLAGAVVTPGLVNTHHHLYQTLTRSRAQQADLFTWLKTLYPTWARIDEEMLYAAARTGLGELALSGCTTVFDHHYVFPRGVTGLVEAELRAAQELGLRMVASRGSMDLGESDGGLPPDSLVESIDEILADTERLAALADGDLIGIAVAPCSPFSVTTRLMEESAALARRLGLQLHTHLAETVEEDAYCRELFGCSPVEYLERVGWLADDVWCAHCVHLSAGDVQTFSARGVGVAHCPTSNLRLGAGVAPVSDLLAAGVRVGLGVDGSASNERSDLFVEVKQALLVARGRGGGAAMTARDALRLGTRGGAAVLRREDIGSLAVGKRADVAVWRTDGLEFGGADDLVANLVLSGPHRVDRLLVGGADVVRGGSLVNATSRRSPVSSASRQSGYGRRDHLDPRARHRARSPGGRRSRRALRTRRHPRRRGDDRRRWPHRLARLGGERPVSRDLSSAVAVLHAHRARGRARRRSRTRSSPDLVVRVRELPRQLTAEQLAELFEGHTRLIDQLAALDDPLGRAREVASALAEDDKKAVLDAHPAIGAKASSARSQSEQGTDDDPRVLAELAELNGAYEEKFGFRFVVFVNRRSRREIVPILRERLERSREQELATGVDELVQIAVDRWRSS